MVTFITTYVAIGAFTYAMAWHADDTDTRKFNDWLTQVELIMFLVFWAPFLMIYVTGSIREKRGLHKD